jgi:hypothetical protein
VREVPGEEDIESVGIINWTDTYEMLECCGCETVTMRHTYWFSENPELEIKYYPPPISRPKPSWKIKLPLDLRTLLDEVYAALHLDSRRLVAMGARTLMDMVLLDKVGDQGSFKEKLERMEKGGYVSQKNRSFLVAALDAGSAAAHRGFSPKRDDIERIMDIVENLLQAVYVLHGAADELRKSTPARPRRRP